MKRWILLAASLLALSGSFSLGQGPPSTQPSKPGVIDGEIALYFSPNGGATEAIVAEIDQAQKTIQLQAYSFSSSDIAKALVAAHSRGVRVTAVLDASQRTAQYSGATFLRNAGIEVLIDDRHAIAHNKVMLIDGKTIITGSFNFTKAAEESNAENLLVIKGRPALASAYAANFAEHLRHARTYEGLGAEGKQQQTPQGAAPPAEAGTAPARVAPVPARVVPAPQAPPAVNDPIVHITRTGKKYHLAGCGSLSRSDFPISLSKAKAQGYTPCARCRPSIPERPVAGASASQANTGPQEIVRPSAALPRLLDLGSTSCIPCKMMAPILEQLKQEQAGKVQVDFIDVWQDKQAGERYQVNLIPTQIFFDASGKEQFRHEGFLGKDEILAKWKELGVDLAQGGASQPAAQTGAR